MKYLSEKFDKPYLALTVRHETRDMSVGHMEKEDFYISTDRLIPGEKLSVAGSVSLSVDYTVQKVSDEAIELSRNGTEFIIEKDAGPVNGISCGGSNGGGVYGSSTVVFEYRTPLSREEMNKISEMAIDAATCQGKGWLERSNRHIRVLNYVERAVKEGNSGLYVALALLSASGNWQYCKIHCPEKFRKIFTEGLRKGALAPDNDNPAWWWMDVAIVNNDPGGFADDMDLYYNALATAAENGVWLARDLFQAIFGMHSCNKIEKH